MTTHVRPVQSLPSMQPPGHAPNCCQTKVHLEQMSVNKSADQDKDVSTPCQKPSVLRGRGDVGQLSVGSLPDHCNAILLIW